MGYLNNNMKGSCKIYNFGTMPTKQLRIIETGNKYGCMNTEESCYKEGMSKKEIREEFLEHRKMAAKDNKEYFDPYKFYIPSQDGKGKAVELTKDMVEAYEDGWDLDIQGDILVITDKIPGVVAGFPVADCPVVIASDLKNGVTATAHCGVEMIDNYLPKMTIESLQSKYNSKLEDIYVYIGAHAGNSWTYDKWPNWAKESFWEETGAITEENGLYKINLRKALLDQLHPEQFETFIVNTTDTRTNPNYYSHSVYTSEGLKEKDGRHFEGAYYQKVKRM